MNVVDILVSIVVVTILVTIILAVVTYVAYKLRLAREPAQDEDDPDGPRYFERHDPPGFEPADPQEGEAGFDGRSEPEATAPEKDENGVEDPIDVGPAPSNEREPRLEGPTEPEPAGAEAESDEILDDSSPLTRLDRDVARLEGHADET